MVKAKYNTHGQAKYKDDGRFTCTRDKCNAFVQYIQLLCMDITKTKHHNVKRYKGRHLFPCYIFAGRFGGAKSEWMLRFLVRRTTIGLPITMPLVFKVEFC